jgi:hypothetical protein
MNDNRPWWLNNRRGEVIFTVTLFALFALFPSFTIVFFTTNSLVVVPFVSILYITAPSGQELPPTSVQWIQGVMYVLASQFTNVLN